MKNIIKTRALVLKARNFGENDKILTILTEKYGRKNVLAKGVRKIGGKLSGLMEAYHLLDIEVTERRGFDIVSDASLVVSYKVLNEGMKGLGLNSVLMEIIEKVSYFGVEDTGIYNILNQYLESYDRNKDKLVNRAPCQIFLTSFMMSVLANMGNIPIVDGCWVCGKNLTLEDGWLSEYGFCHNDCHKNEIIFGKVYLAQIELLAMIMTQSIDDLMLYDFEEEESRFVFDYLLYLIDLNINNRVKSVTFLENIYKDIAHE